MADQLRRHWTTHVGQAAGHPAAFLVVVVYALLWLFFDRASFDWNAIATLAVFMMTLFIQRAEHLSGGRVTLGVGYGWNRTEAEDHGVDWARRHDVERREVARDRIDQGRHRRVELLPPLVPPELAPLPVLPPMEAPVVALVLAGVVLAMATVPNFARRSRLTMNLRFARLWTVSRFTWG